MPCDPFGMNPGGPIGFNDLLMNGLWKGDPPCASAAGSYWDVYNRTEGKSKAFKVNDSISKGSSKPSKLH